MAKVRLFSRAAELQVILAILGTDSKLSKQALADVSEGLLYTEDMQHVFGLIRDTVQKNGISGIPTLQAFLTHPRLKDTARLILENGESKIAKKADLDHYIESLKSYAKKRQYVGLAEGITNVLSSGDDDATKKLDNLLESAVVTLTASSEGAQLLSLGHKANVDAEKLVKYHLKKREKRIIPTGYSEYDAHAGGFERGEVVLVATTTGGGKSMFALQTSINQYQDFGYTTSIISLEMSEEQYMDRLLANLSGVEHQKLRLRDSPNNPLSTAEQKRLIDSFKSFQQHGELHNCRWSLFSLATVSMTEIEALIAPINPDVLYIDYSALVDAPGQEQWQQLSNLVKYFKGYAKRTRSVVVMLAQLALSEDRLRYSQGMTEHADTLLSWRLDEKAINEGIITVVPLKHRSGSTRPFHVKMDFEHSRIGDYNPKGLRGAPKLAKGKAPSTGAPSYNGKIPMRAQMDSPDDGLLSMPGLPTTKAAAQIGD